MELALQEALEGKEEGNMPVGSVIVRGGEVIARGHNLATSTRDVTAHAETVALRNASQGLGLEDFSGCTLYTTMEPCPMCGGAILVARVSTLVLGARIPPQERKYGEYAVERLLELTGWGSRLRLVTGVLQQRCEEIRL